MAYDLIGKNFTPPDIYGKVTGKAKYAGDYRAEGMVFCRLLTSPMPHAKVKKIDASAALKLKGVLGVLTSADVPAFPPPNNPILTSEPLYVGDPIPTALNLAGADHAATRSTSTPASAISAPTPMPPPRASPPRCSNANGRIASSSAATAAGTCRGIRPRSAATPPTPSRAPTTSRPWTPGRSSPRSRRRTSAASRTTSTSATRKCF